MKIKNIILISIIALVLMVSLGCIDSNNDVEVQQTQETVTTIQEPPSMPEPEETIDTYIFAFNRMQSDYIYDNLLSDTLKNQTSKNNVHNSMYAFVAQGYTIADYSIIEKNVTGKIANIEIEFNWDLRGFRVAHTQNVNFTLENNEWKITDKLVLM